MHSRVITAIDFSNGMVLVNKSLALSTCNDFRFDGITLKCRANGGTFLVGKYQDIALNGRKYTTAIAFANQLFGMNTYFGNHGGNFFYTDGSLQGQGTVDAPLQIFRGFLVGKTFTAKPQKSERIVLYGDKTSGPYIYELENMDVVIIPMPGMWVSDVNGAEAIIHKVTQGPDPFNPTYSCDCVIMELATNAIFTDGSLMGNGTSTDPLRVPRIEIVNYIIDAPVGQSVVRSIWGTKQETSIYLDDLLDPDNAYVPVVDMQFEDIRGSIGILTSVQLTTTNLYTCRIMTLNLSNAQDANLCRLFGYVLAGAINSDVTITVGTKYSPTIYIKFPDEDDFVVPYKHLLVCDMQGGMGMITNVTNVDYNNYTIVINILEEPDFTIATDGTTISGDGTSSKKIALKKVFTDGTTITGDGATANTALKVASSAIVVDGSFSGSGTTASPYGVARVRVYNLKWTTVIDADLTVDIYTSPSGQQSYITYIGQTAKIAPTVGMFITDEAGSTGVITKTINTSGKYSTTIRIIDTIQADNVITDGTTISGDGTSSNKIALKKVFNDGTTITGDGTSASPLKATAVAPQTDGTTISGDGTSSNKIALKKVFNDGTTITGDGTSASPLKATAAAPQTDGTTISGDGTSSNKIALKKVFTDGTTITGDGTSANPLVGSGGSNLKLSQDFWQLPNESWVPPAFQGLIVLSQLSAIGVYKGSANASTDYFLGCPIAGRNYNIPHSRADLSIIGWIRLEGHDLQLGEVFEYMGQDQVIIAQAPSQSDDWTLSTRTDTNEIVRYSGTILDGINALKEGETLSSNGCGWSETFDGASLARADYLSWGIQLIDPSGARGQLVFYPFQGSDGKFFSSWAVEKLSMDQPVLRLDVTIKPAPGFADTLLTADIGFFKHYNDFVEIHTQDNTIFWNPNSAPVSYVSVKYIDIPQQGEMVGIVLKADVAGTTSYVLDYPYCKRIIYGSIGVDAWNPSNTKDTAVVGSNSSSVDIQREINQLNQVTKGLGNQIADFKNNLNTITDTYPSVVSKENDLISEISDLRARIAVIEETVRCYSDQLADLEMNVKELSAMNDASHSKLTTIIAFMQSSGFDKDGMAKIKVQSDRLNDMLKQLPSKKDALAAYQKTIDNYQFQMKNIINTIKLAQQYIIDHKYH